MILAGVGALPASSAEPPAVTVDYANGVRDVRHVGQGFLYGLAQDGTGAANAFLNPLKPNIMRGGGARIPGQGWIGDGYVAGTGYGARIRAALDQAKVTTQTYGAEFNLMFNDLWGADTGQPSDSRYPCDDNNCSNWVTFVEQVVSDVEAAGLKVTYEPWNEPDNRPFWPRDMNSSQYFAMWDTAFKTIRRLDPDARIEGPATYVLDEDVIDAFLDHVVDAGTVPDVLDHHNLRNEDPIVVGQMLDRRLADHGLSNVQTSINEYLSRDQLNPGGTAWYLSRLARSGIDLAARGVYPQEYPGQQPCCMADDLGGILTPTPNGLAPSGEYWAYRAFADLSGKFVNATGQGAVEALASYDHAAQRSVVLVGATPGGTSAYTGPVTLNLKRISSAAALASGGAVRVQVKRIPDRTVLVDPVVVSDQIVTVTEGAASVQLAFANSAEALAVYITPANRAATTFVDSSTTSGPNRFSFDSAWKTASGIADLYAGTATTQAEQAPTSMTFTFTGTGVTIHGVQDKDQGISEYSLDGGTKVVKDGYSPMRDSQAVLYSVSGLSNTTHTLKITAPATKNPAGTSTIVAIDAAEVTVPGLGVNLLANPGFEQNLTDWTSTLDTAASYTEGQVGTVAPHSGKLRLTHYSGSPFQAFTSQTVAVPNGTYAATAWVVRGGNHNASYFEVKDYGGTARTVGIPSTSMWRQVVITGITVTDGEVTVGLYDNGNAGNWTSVDDVQLYRTS
ncbi:hypothetical protein F4560_003253 [Saccharothrix ecbatanensis]|uniref:Glycosyl hydrolases family 39 N-terminal catalytic domain-containing protein n=1 Tax=Saccharothrix ecbatanensis TaxID=1105145 RepID=A0A7W9M111_9PSEU|nr:hypothetical protein [Saccharothrix ecbatanensis]MBB5803485.1 hypothetical protein [Saccharothrix ecbatanensis]